MTDGCTPDVADRLFELRARWLLQDHPWAARALADAERVPGTDGVEELRIRLHDPAAKQSGVRAIATVLGLVPMPPPVGSALDAVRTFEDAEGSLRLVVLDTEGGVRCRDCRREVL